MHRYLRAQKHRVQLAARAITMMIATGLCLSATAAPTPENAGDEGWSEWKTLGKAYVARRREPARLNLPRVERRQVNVQARLEKLLRKKHKLQARLEAKGWPAVF